MAKRIQRKDKSSMPPDIYHLFTTGHLMASERAEVVPNRPLMMCIKCGERPLDLIFRHTPWTKEELRGGKFDMCECGKVHGKLIPGTAWGADVTVICPCCSILALLGKCPHKETRKAA